MPRLRYIEENEKTPHTRELIESAKRTGAPDPRVEQPQTAAASTFILHLELARSTAARFKIRQCAYADMHN